MVAMPFTALSDGAIAGASPRAGYSCTFRCVLEYAREAAA